MSFHDKFYELKEKFMTLGFREDHAVTAALIQIQQDVKHGIEYSF